MSTHYVLKIQYVNKPPETRNIGARVTTIGREAGDIVLGDPQSSGRHAEIHFENGNVRVKDLGSTNGTFFNGQRSPEFALQAGQGFSIGQTVMTLMAVHGAQQRPGAGKTMIAMGGMPPRPPGPPGAPPPGAPPAPSGFGAPPGPPAGAPPAGARPQGGFGAPPPGSPPPGAPPQGGFGAPPPSSPPGAPPQGGFGAPPAGAPPQGGFGAPPPGSPPPGSPPPGGGFGAPPPGAPPPGGDQPGQMAPAGGAFAATGAAMSQQPPQQQFGGAPQQFGGPGPMATSGGGEARGDFAGTGGELLGQLFVGYLLTVITFGIYGPWFMCKFANFIAQRVTFGPTGEGTVRFRFEGQGGELFVTFLVGYLLTLVTFGIYTPWFMCKLAKFYADNSVATTDNGSTYKPSFEGQGGDLFVTFLVGYLLTLVTFGIYSPWFICKINKWFSSNTKVTKNGQQVGELDFVGEGGDLLVTFIVGYLLTLITFGIYMAWFQVKLMVFNADNTKLTVEGRRYGMRFTGEGGELFVIMLVGNILSMLTFGIYSFWMMAKLLKWQLSNTVVFPDGGGQMAMGAPMGGNQAFAAPPAQGQMYGGAPPQGQLGAPQQGAYGAPPQGGPQGGGFA